MAERALGAHGRTAHRTIGGRAWMPTVAGGLVIAVLVGSVVAFAPLIDRLIGRSVWQAVWLDGVPARISLLLAVAVVLGGLVVTLLSRVGDIRHVYVLLTLLSCQLTGFGIGPLDAFDAVTLGFLAIWIALHLAGHPRLQRVDLPLLALVALLPVVAQIAHLAVQNPVKWVVGVLVLVKVTILPLLMVNMLNERTLIERWAATMRWVALGVAIIGIAQFLAAYLGVFEFTLIGNTEDAKKPTPLGFVMRASAFSFTAQHYSAFLLLSLPFWLFRWSPAPGLLRLRDAVPIAIILVGVVVSWNYSGMVGVIVVLLLFPFARWPRHAIHIGLAFGVLGLVAYYSGLLDLAYDLSLGNKGVAKGAGQRLFLLELGLEKIWRDPLLGTGVRSMADFSGNYWGRPVHNAYIQAFSELGVAGAVALVLVLVLAASTMVLIALDLPRGDREIPAAAGLGLLGFMVVCLNEPNLENLNTWLAVGLAAAIMTLHRRGCWRREGP